jgi:cytoskeleton protein RodZ
MRTGNAGALEISVDGRPAPPLGRIGAVRRNVLLDPQALIAGTAARD